MPRTTRTAPARSPRWPRRFARARAAGPDRLRRDRPTLVGVLTALVAALGALIFNAVSATATGQQIELSRQAQLTGAWLGGADLSEARLTNANLTCALLWGANLRMARLDGADLTRASLFNADLTGATLADATLTGTNLAGAATTATSGSPAPSSTPKPGLRC